MSWLRLLLHAFLLNLLAAFVVDVTFRAAFVQDVVAYGVTIYTAVLTALLVGVHPNTGHWSQRRLMRALLALPIAGATVASCRSWLLFPLPFSDFMTTGFSPYVLVIGAGLSVAACLEILFQSSKDATGSSTTKRAPSE